MADILSIAQRVKAGLGLNVPDDAFSFQVSQNIFPALEELTRSVARTHLRDHLLTNPLTTTVALSGGSADLTEIIEDGVLLDCLRFGTITHPSNSFPLQWRTTQGQAALGSVFGPLFLGCWLQGNILHTISEEVLTGNLSFSVPRVPGLDELPEKLEGKLVDILLKRMGTPKERVA